MDRLNCSFGVNAARGAVFAQRQRLIDIALLSLLTGTERPTVHVRAFERSGVHGELSVVSFKEQRPDETFEQTCEQTDRGLCDLRITFEPLAESRTWVMVECFATALVPAARAVLEELARRYPEAADAIRPYLNEDGASRSPRGNVRVPGRLKDRNRWQATWSVIKAHWRRGKDYTDICGWIKRMHPELECQPDTLRDIIAAGEAGLLDAPNG